MFVLHKYKYLTNICFPIIFTLTNYSFAAYDSVSDNSDKIFN